MIRHSVVGGEERGVKVYGWCSKGREDPCLAKRKFKKEKQGKKVEGAVEERGGRILVLPQPLSARTHILGDAHGRRMHMT